jgi:hypothetical protein
LNVNNYNLSVGNNSNNQITHNGVDLAANNNAFAGSNANANNNTSNQDFYDGQSIYNFQINLPSMSLRSNASLWNLDFGTSTNSLNGRRRRSDDDGRDSKKAKESDQ